jgi:hypothetical protein
VRMKISSVFRKPDKFISLVFCFVASILVTLGYLSSLSNQNLDEAEGLGVSQFVGLSTSAWHQELDVYFTLKVLSTEKYPGLGLREPVLIERESLGFIPLKFSDYTKFSIIKDRPYLSSSGILADLGKMATDFLSIFGVSRLSGLLIFYILNVFLNSMFVFLLLKFGSSYISRSLYLNFYRFTVVSPWVLLDSTSIMLSPAIRFAGVFAILLLWYRKGNDWQFGALFTYCLAGVVISSLNGFEFFFFELAILLVYLFVLMNRSSIRITLSFWLSLSLTAWLASVLLWSLTIFSNLKTFSDTAKLILYTLFKHSFLRFDTPPLGAVPSGDNSLAFFTGLTELLGRMSIFLPYPFPKSFQSKLHLSDDLLSVMNLLTSVAVLIVLMSLFSKNLSSSKVTWIGIGFWCLSAIAVNSYVYNHPHHMPPVGLFLILSIFIHFFREKPNSEYSNS